MKKKINMKIIYLYGDFILFLIVIL